MKDAKGHGSDPHGAAHQTGIEQATAPGPVKWGMRTPEGQAFIRSYYSKKS